MFLPKAVFLFCLHSLLLWKKAIHNVLCIVSRKMSPDKQQGTFDAEQWREYQNKKGIEIKTWLCFQSCSPSSKIQVMYSDSRGKQGTVRTSLSSVSCKVNAIPVFHDVIQKTRKEFNGSSSFFFLFFLFVSCQEFPASCFLRFPFYLLLSHDSSPLFFSSSSPL